MSSDSKAPGADQAPPFNWRDYLKVHPAADEYPLLRDSDPAAFRALVEDIRAHGTHTQLVFWSDGKGNVQLLDGRNRLDVDAELGILGVRPKDDIYDEDLLVFVKEWLGDAWVPLAEYAHQNVVDWSEKVQGDPYAIAASYNAHRRMLTPEQKRKRIAAAIKRNSEKSLRAIGEETGADKNTVRAVKAKMVATGEVHQLEKTVGKDGKARKHSPGFDAACEWAKRLGREVTLFGSRGFCLSMPDGHPGVCHHSLKSLKAALKEVEEEKAGAGAEADDAAASGEQQQQVDDRTVKEIFGSVEAADAAALNYKLLQGAAADIEGGDPRAVAAWARVEQHELPEFRAALDRIIGFAAAVKAALDDEPHGDDDDGGGKPHPKVEEPADTVPEPEENAAQAADPSLDIPGFLLRASVPSDVPAPIVPPAPAPSPSPVPPTWLRVRTTYVFQSPDDPSWRKFSDVELEAHKRSAERYCKRFSHYPEGLERARKHIEDVQELLDIRQRAKCTVAAGSAAVH